MSYITKTFTFEGKRYYVRGKTEREALLKLANKRRDLEEGKVAVSGNMTVSAWAYKAVEAYKTNQKDITKVTLRRDLGIAPGTMSKLNKGEEVAMSVLLRICEYLNCDIGDICEVVRADKIGNE